METTSGKGGLVAYMVGSLPCKSTRWLVPLSIYKQMDRWSFLGKSRVWFISSFTVVSSLNVNIRRVIGRGGGYTYVHRHTT